jgi:hypothetical protein
MKNPVKRREFLQQALFTTASSLVTWGLPMRALAQSIAASTAQEPQFFILIRAEGGWDVSLSMDPWTAEKRPDESDYFLEYRRDQLIPAGSRFVGPALEPLKPYLPRMSIVNGLFMSSSDGGHPSEALYAQSGNGQAHLGLLAAELEGRVLTSPFGILANRAIYTAEARKTIWDINEIIMNRGLKDSDMLLNVEDKNSELSKARKAILSNTQRIQKFNQILSSQKDQVKNEHAIAAAFASGLSSSVALELSGNLDTHGGHKETHLKGLTGVFQSIRDILDALAALPGANGKSILDHTTLMVTSEFTRSPALNPGGGKEHNVQCNSALLMGPGLKPGMMGAASLIDRATSTTGTSYLVGSPIDKTTFEVVARRENAMFIRPENIVATVAKSMGCDPGLISQELAAAKLLSPILKG